MSLTIPATHFGLPLAKLSVAALTLTSLIISGCDHPQAPRQQKPALEAASCPDLFLKLNKEVEQVLRQYKRVNRLGGRRFFYCVDVENNREAPQQLTIYSSMMLTALFTYQPVFYSMIDDEYVAVCAGEAAIGSNGHHAQAICDILSRGWYGKRLSRQELDRNVVQPQFYAPIWRVAIQKGVATIIDSTNSMPSQGGKISWIRFVPPPSREDARPKR